MNYYIEKDGKTVDMCESEEDAWKTADAWQEMYPNADIRVLLEVEK